jgi:hypothetical protein
MLYLATEAFTAVVCPRPTALIPFVVNLFDLGLSALIVEKKEDTVNQEQTHKFYMVWYFAYVHNRVATFNVRSKSMSMLTTVHIYSSSTMKP